VITKSVAKRVKKRFLLKQPLHLNTLITICNWDTYPSNTDMDVKDDVKDALNPCQTSVTPALTNKNDKNVKNEKNLSLRENFS